MSFLADLEAAASELARLNPPKPQRYNPRPPGVPRPGSASAAVLDYLRSVTGFRTHAQIVFGINRRKKESGEQALSGKAVDWALLFLKKHQLIEAASVPRANSRYLRYRAAPKKEDSHE